MHEFEGCLTITILADNRHRCNIATGPLYSDAVCGAPARYWVYREPPGGEEAYRFTSICGRFMCARHAAQALNLNRKGVILPDTTEMGRATGRPPIGVERGPEVEACRAPKQV